MKFKKFLLLWICIAKSAGACPNNLPEEIVQIANNYGCEEVDTFFSRPGMVEPPFLYGFKNGKRENSIIFWCSSKVKKSLYKLIAYVKSDSLDVCSGIIYQTENFPGGLSLSVDHEKKLEGYRSVKGRKKVTGINYKGSVIYSFYDGVGYTFVCSSEGWLYKHFD
ncbi:MAG: hypothetical protein GY820_01385 [Gammaproteobacteria bacterium]|nr:hypothetical protein [Gammaproteobacteria bacterium]